MGIITHILFRFPRVLGVCYAVLCHNHMAVCWDIHGVWLGLASQAQYSSTQGFKHAIPAITMENAPFVDDRPLISMKFHGHFSWQTFRLADSWRGEQVKRRHVRRRSMSLSWQMAMKFAKRRAVWGKRLHLPTSPRFFQGLQRSPEPFQFHCYPMLVMVGTVDLIEHGWKWMEIVGTCGNWNT